MKSNTKTTKLESHTCCGGSHGSAPADGGAATVPLKDGVLDVRQLAPARRHTLIFETYNSLGKGQSFVLANDHDPKPLYYQFSYEHAGQFSWNYEQQGPEVWRVRIGKV